MSLFEQRDIDKILLEYISFDSTVVLSQVNTYYYNATKNILAPLREFNKIKSTLAIDIEGYKHIITPDKNIETYDVLSRVLIQAYIYGNLDVIKYITKNNHPIYLATKLNVTIFNAVKSEINRRYIDTILACIAIQKRRIDILLFMAECYGFETLILSDEYFDDYYCDEPNLNNEIISILEAGGF